MKVYTKRGDDGTTGLLYGGRVDKDDLRTSAYGTVDETVSALGMARAALPEGEGPEGRWHDAVLTIQRELFVVGAQLATHSDHWPKLTVGVSLTTPEMVDVLESRIDALTEAHPLPQAFVVPGASPAGAAIDLARTICRRAERYVVAMQRADLLPDDAPLRYLNRLSDYLFVLARAVEGGRHTPTRAE
ncbi:cob(I)yrinic acid a,c-diamide adenosyltransferase [Euzebya sp.]|uniref:cob(I)yrinic acid a,c-diamide adenosyltransferase n=1 Tax=Euzebya sp. TaxID=1971409 RepID=UPI00351457CC